MLRAALTDGNGIPLDAKLVTFTIGTPPVTATALTDAAGNALGAVTLPATLNGAQVLTVSFAGDDTYTAATATAPVIVYQQTPFVVWGGNTPGLHLGDSVNFWGGSWSGQVTGGDFQVKGHFLGWVVVPAGRLGVCEALLSTTSAPPIDEGCWSSKGGNVSPPDVLPEYIQVIVTASMNKAKGTNKLGSNPQNEIFALDVVNTSFCGFDPEFSHGISLRRAESVPRAETVLIETALALGSCQFVQ